MAIDKGKRRTNRYQPVIGVPEHILESPNLSPGQKQVYGASAKKATTKRGRPRKEAAKTAKTGRKTTAKRTRSKRSAPAESVAETKES